MKVVAVLLLFSLFTLGRALVMLYEYLPFFLHFRSTYQIQNSNVIIHVMCPGHEEDENLKNVMNTFENCTKEALNLNRTFCHTLEGPVTECAKPLIAALDKCVESDMKKLPEFLSREILSIFNYICNLKGENLLELLNPCWFVFNDSDAAAKAEFKLCAEKMEEIDRSKKIPSVSKICSFIPDVLPCVDRHLKRSCATPETRSTFMGLYQALYKPCNEI